MYRTEFSHFNPASMMAPGTGSVMCGAAVKFHHRLLQRLNLKVKERHRWKSVLTKTGLLELPQDLYTDWETGKTAPPVLQKLGIKPHQKVTDALIGSCLEAVTGLSQTKVAELVTEGELTRQTISNYVKNSTDTALFEARVQNGR